jgi:hypothetical protein
VQLTQQQDCIIWRFTSDGKYMASSAYKVQFIGSDTDKRLFFRKYAGELCIIAKKKRLEFLQREREGMHAQLKQS